MNHQRYSLVQVLCGLREVWRSEIGSHASFEADTRIDRFMKDDGTWDELDLADIILRLERFFGFKCSQKEWDVFLGIEIAQRSFAEWEQNHGPNMTFGALAQFIVDRAPVVASFEPITLLGRACATAGIFTGIEQVAEKVKNGCRRFAPSSRILDVMRGNDLHRFWTQLRWMTEDSTPPLPTFWRGVTAYAIWLGILAIPLGFIGANVTSNINWLISPLLGAVTLYLLALAYKQMANPLPSNVVSFRDLSIIIAESLTNQP